MSFVVIFNPVLQQAAKARACGNLGNAYSALSEYTEAIRLVVFSE